ncbi:MAG: hypothetical protein M9939_20795 [Mesorhizobium sp.]|nr:hypothetical protein [Mesorhizobium sp.]MCO5163574.1 hypothetical protein [Mesorhizobium sp.]
MRSLAGALVAAAIAGGVALPALSSPGEISQVVRLVKSNNKDFKKLCQAGAGKIRAEVTKATIKLATSGSITSNPRTIGEAAGKKIAADCKK